MALFLPAYGSSLGKFGNGRLIIRGSSRVLGVSTKVDKDFKNSRLSLSTEVGEGCFNLFLMFETSSNLAAIAVLQSKNLLSFSNFELTVSHMHYAFLVSKFLFALPVPVTLPFALPVPLLFTIL